MNVIGKKINHKIFGKGTIISQEDSRIFIKFDKKEHDIALAYPVPNYTDFFVFLDKVESTKEELIFFLVNYFVKKNSSSVYTKKELYDICNNRFLNITFDDLSDALLLEVMQKLSERIDVKFILTSNNLTIVPGNEQNKPNSENPLKKELVHFFSAYLLERRPELISCHELASIASEKFFKGTNLEALSLTPEFLKKIIIETNKEGSIVYELFKTKEIKKISDAKTTPKKNLQKETKPIETLTDPVVVMELIKSMVLTDLKAKQFYTLKEINEYFLKNFNKDPGNLITRKLLTKTCIELHDENKEYYYVDGNGSFLQLWKANTIREWQRYGLGTVYIPTIQVNDKKYDIRNFTLYVYESLNNVRCVNSVKHIQENVTINANDISGNSVSFNAFFCSICNKYYTTTDVVEQIFPLKNYPFVHLEFPRYSRSYRRDESELMVYGYNAKSDGPSSSERQNLLASLMTFGFLSKEKIVAIIKDHINYNGRRSNMENAKQKWKEDLDFVQNFNLSKQRIVKAQDMSIIYKGKRQK